MPVAGCRRRSHGVGVRGALASPYFNRSDTISVATCCRNALHLDWPCRSGESCASLYPAHWRELSRRVRFERAGGMCQGCGRPHGSTVRCLPDGRWFDQARKHGATGAGASPDGPTWNTWRGCGRPASCSPPRTSIMIRPTTGCATCAVFVSAAT